MTHKKIITASAFAAFAACAFAASPVSAAPPGQVNGSAPSANTDDGGKKRWTVEEYNKLRAQEPNTALTVTLDPKTGDVVNVVKASAGTGAPRISNTNTCAAGQACYSAGKYVWADQGFWGTPGTFKGNWPYRSGYRSDKYVVRACWTQACAKVNVGPWSSVNFDGQLVTGTSFTIV